METKIVIEGLAGWPAFYFLASSPLVLSLLLGFKCLTIFQ